LSWCKVVERVLAESDLIRKESDDVGPSTELDYWKARMAKFNRCAQQDSQLGLCCLRGTFAALCPCVSLSLS